MATSFKRKCPNCGAFLRIYESGESVPGCKEHVEACCPKCDYVVHSKNTSGTVRAVEITEKEFNEESY